MATTFALVLWKFFENQAREIVKQTIDSAYLEIQSKSPVDTGKYISDHKKLPIEIVGETVVGRIINDGEYAEKVERGWRKTPVNWHLRDWSIFYNKGAETYERGLAKTKAKFSKLLKW